uniref:Uncharacterized protein n=1 Tax=Opuntia streptacantha TaxID=393608 RepID=A0A7C9DB52_OPUST
MDFLGSSSPGGVSSLSLYSSRVIRSFFVLFSFLFFSRVFFDFGLLFPSDFNDYSITGFSLATCLDIYCISKINFEAADLGLKRFSKKILFCLIVIVYHMLHMQ